MTDGWCYQCQTEFLEPKVVWRRGGAHLGQRMPYLVSPCCRGKWQWSAYVTKGNDAR